MVDLTGSNCVVLDLETLHSAEDCRHCGSPEMAHTAEEGTPTGVCPSRGFAGGLRLFFAPIGWDNKVALGLSIGCYWDYQDMALHWFDRHTLETTMRLFEIGR